MSHPEQETEALARQTLLRLEQGGAAGSGKPTAASVVAELNERHAIVLLGERPGVLQELPEDASEHGAPFRLMTIGGFKEWMRNQRVKLRGRERPKADVWLNDPLRRQFEGICFAPGRDVSGYYNLWRGFAVEPATTAAADAEGSCDRLLDHLLENVCGGNERLFEWVVGWFAAIVQRPDEKPGTALVLRGTQGTGKTIVGRAVGSLLGAHYTLVADSRFVVGRFNSHLSACLLLQADEAFWAGDHAAAGRLKDLVTGDWQLIEYKGREPVRVRNHVRLLITSNAQWVVPAGPEERRFAVLDVADHQRQNAAYFAAIAQELEAGGRAKLLRYLLDYDLSSINLRTIPDTAGLVQQKVASLSPIEHWWLDVLQRGRLPGDTLGQGIARKERIHEAYIAHAQRTGVQRRAAETELGIFLNKQVPELKETRPRVPTPSGTERQRCYVFPPLAECRRTFGGAGDRFPWPGEPAEWEPDPEGGR